MKKGIVGVTVFWLSIVGISFWWNLIDDKKEFEQLALETARAFFQQIVVARAWNAEHGGVYVPITETVQPNPYLEDPLRDVTTDKGVKLTKINPAYMTRQIAEIASDQSGIKFHITSLVPLRPQNKPTQWEKEWLLSFEEGAKEQGEFIAESNHNVYRYMAPLKVKKSCLKCHAKQGYKIDDIRGGISVTIPYLIQQKNTGMYVGYGVTAVVGTILIIFGGILLARRREELIKTNESLQKGIAEQEKLITQLKDANSQIKTLSGIVPICSYCKEIRDDKGYWNQLEKFISEHSSAQFSHSICPKCMKKMHPEINLDED